MYLCVMGILPLSMVYRLDCGTVLLVWCFASFYGLSIGLQNCSVSLVFCLFLWFIDWTVGLFCQSGVLPLSMVYRLDCGTVLLVWYFSSFYGLSIGLQNCSVSLVFCLFLWFIDWTVELFCQSGVLPLSMVYRLDCGTVLLVWCFASFYGLSIGLQNCSVSLVFCLFLWFIDWTVELFCQSGILPLSMVYRLDCRTVLLVWYFASFYGLSIGLWNCSVCLVFFLFLWFIDWTIELFCQSGILPLSMVYRLDCRTVLLVWCFASFYGLSIGLWNCSVSLVFCLFLWFIDWTVELFCLSGIFPLSMVYRLDCRTVLLVWYFASFYGLSIGLWNCSVSLVFCLFLWFIDWTVELFCQSGVFPLSMVYRLDCRTVLLVWCFASFYGLSIGLQNCSVSLVFCLFLWFIDWTVELFCQSGVLPLSMVYRLDCRTVLLVWCFSSFYGLSIGLQNCSVSLVFCLFLWFIDWTVELFCQSGVLPLSMVYRLDCRTVLLVWYFASFYDLSIELQNCSVTVVQCLFLWFIDWTVELFCQSGVLPLSMVYRLDCGTVLFVWYFSSFYGLSIGLWNCSVSLVFCLFLWFIDWTVELFCLSGIFPLSMVYRLDCRTVLLVWYFASFYGLSIGLWNCSVSLVFFLFLWFIDWTVELFCQSGILPLSVVYRLDCRTVLLVWCFASFDGLSIGLQNCSVSLVFCLFLWFIDWTVELFCQSGVLPLSMVYRLDCGTVLLVWCFASFYGLSIGLWNCSVSLVFFLFLWFIDWTVELFCQSGVLPLSMVYRLDCRTVLLVWCFSTFYGLSIGLQNCSVSLVFCLFLWFIDWTVELFCLSGIFPLSMIYRLNCRTVLLLWYSASFYGLSIGLQNCSVSLVFCLFLWFIDWTVELFCLSGIFPLSMIYRLNCRTVLLLWYSASFYGLSIGLQNCSVSLVFCLFLWFIDWTVELFCQSGILPLSMVYRLDCRTVLLVWYFASFYGLSIGLQNCSVSLVFCLFLWFIDWTVELFCQSGILPLSMVYRLDCRTVLLVWCFASFYGLSIGLQNCSVSLVFCLFL